MIGKIRRFFRKLRESIGLVVTITRSDHFLDQIDMSGEEQEYHTWQGGGRKKGAGSNK